MNPCGDASFLNKSWRLHHCMRVTLGLPRVEGRAYPALPEGRVRPRLQLSDVHSGRRGRPLRLWSGFPACLEEATLPRPELCLFDAHACLAQPLSGAIIRELPRRDLGWLPSLRVRSLFHVVEAASLTYGEGKLVEAISPQEVHAGAHSLDRPDAEDNTCTRDRTSRHTLDHWREPGAGAAWVPTLARMCPGSLPAPLSRRLEMGAVLTLPMGLAGRHLCGKGRCSQWRIDLTGCRFRLRMIHDEPYTVHSLDSPVARSTTWRATVSTQTGSRSSGRNQGLGRGITMATCGPANKPDNFHPDRRVSCGYLHRGYGAGSMGRWLSGHLWLPLLCLRWSRLGRWLPNPRGAYAMMWMGSQDDHWGEAPSSLRSQHPQTVAVVAVATSRWLSAAFVMIDESDGACHHLTRVCRN